MTADPTRKRHSPDGNLRLQSAPPLKKDGGRMQAPFPKARLLIAYRKVSLTEMESVSTQGPFPGKRQSLIGNQSAAQRFSVAGT